MELGSPTLVLQPARMLLPVEGAFALFGALDHEA